MSYLFVFRYDQFGIGGIQTWVYAATKYLIEGKWQVLILTNKNRQINEGFLDVFRNHLVSVLDYDEEYYWDYSSYDKVKYYVFTVEGLAKAFKFKHDFKQLSVDLFYCVPNFRGADYYYDETFGKWFNKKLNHRFAIIFGHLNQAGQIRYFSKSHNDMMQSRYHYVSKDYSDVAVPVVERIVPFDEEDRRRVIHRKEFRIISVSRFDFPHKGYIIGLIEAFERIKRKYPNVTLSLVGSGHSMPEIRRRVSLLDEASRSSITYVGEVNYDDLPSLFRQANLNISLSGCCTMGAKCGVLSIPARHFSYSCEVYGFIPDSLSMITSEEEGTPVDPYIEQVINMPEDEYIARCKKGYESLSSSDVTTSLFDSNAEDYTLSMKDIRFILVIHYLIRRYIPIKQRIYRAIHGELFSMIYKKVLKPYRKDV